MKAIVHIGTEKTGTTSIQKFLYQNRKKLKSAGYHFLQSAGKTNNRALPAYFVIDDRFDDFFRNEDINTTQERDVFRQQFIAQFEKEISALPKSIHTVIISSEHFHSRLRTEEELDNVYRFLSKYFDTFQIVCYLRDQASTCTSYYSTAMKSGNDSSFAEFVQRCKPENYYFNYLMLLENWERCFGSDALDVSLFRKDTFLNGNLLDDFTAKIDPKLVGRLNTNVQIENESLTPAGQSLARAVNLAFPIRTGRPQLKPLRDKCKKNVYDRFKGPGRQPSLNVQLKIFAEFGEVNEALRQKYFPKMDEIFTRPNKESIQNASVDDDFIDGLMHILRTIHTTGRGILSEEEYPQVYKNIMSCVSDILQSEEEGKKAGKEAIISLDDLRLLRTAAQKIEQRDILTAKNLLSLVNEIQPSLPGVTQKLEEYGHRVDKSGWPQFVISCTLGNEMLSAAQDPSVKEKYDEWLESLSGCIVGSTINSLRSIQSIHPDGSKKEARSHLTTGFTVIRAESAEEAYEIAARLPLLHYGGKVEVSEWIAIGPQT